ncbi:hypothetical protein SAMN05216359_12236 [Roseateles sp. YR242]|uniref:hypothetical protein n=1 Tax=Roseateles sp. YR242 TaxID=1855305 RepID=UPI0008AF6270|nr:hypothetical protein [Roseateles sp. YR242]SEL89598.1 hypothetical protein SAMN05216359_12236 [Roseateles sp. YR242]
MNFKTLSTNEISRLAGLPLDHEWENVIADGFLVASDEEHPSLWNVVDPINIHGLSDIVIASVELCMARLSAHVAADDGLLRLQSAWAATVDQRYSHLSDANPSPPTQGDLWTRPEWFVRAILHYLHFFLERGRTAKVRQLAVTALLTAEHLCGRDVEFDRWLKDLLQTKRQSSPRRSDEVDNKSRDDSFATPAELTGPDRADRLAGLDPTQNPYLKSAAAMAAQGFTGSPYPATP